MTPKQLEQFESGMKNVAIVGERVSQSNQALTTAALAGMDQNGEQWKQLWASHNKNLSDLAQITKEMMGWAQLNIFVADE